MKAKYLFIINNTTLTLSKNKAQTLRSEPKVFHTCRFQGSEIQESMMESFQELSPPRQQARTEGFRALIQRSCRCTCCLPPAQFFSVPAGHLPPASEGGQGCQVATKERCKFGGSHHQAQLCLRHAVIHFPHPPPFFTLWLKCYQFASLNFQCFSFHLSNSLMQKPLAFPSLSATIPPFQLHKLPVVL